MKKLLVVLSVVGLMGCGSEEARIGDSVEVTNDDGTVDRYVNMGSGVTFVEENVDLEEEARLRAEAKASREREIPEATTLTEGNHVEVNAMTRQLIGKWGTGQSIDLIVAQTDDRIVLYVPGDDYWKWEVKNARLIGDTVQFTQTLVGGGDVVHPFSMSMITAVRPVENGTLELKSSTVSLPEVNVDGIDLTAGLEAAVNSSLAEANSTFLKRIDVD